MYITAIVPDSYTIDFLVCFCINGLSIFNFPVDGKKLCKLFLFKADNIVMKNLEATTQLGGFNQRLPTSEYKNRLPYSGPHWHKDDAIDTFSSSVKSHDGTTTIYLIFGTNTLLTDVNAIG